MNLDIDALKKTYQAVQNAAEQSKTVYYYTSKFIPCCDSAGNNVVHKFLLAGEPAYVVLIHDSLASSFCKMVTEAGLTPKTMDWDEYSERQYSLFMKRRADAVIASMVWDDALYDWQVSSM